MLCTVRVVLTVLGLMDEGMIISVLVEIIVMIYSRRGFFVDVDKFFFEKLILRLSFGD